MMSRSERTSTTIWSEDICERRGVSRDEALELWLLLQQGKRDEITCLFQNNQIAERINGIRFAAGFTLVILLSGCATHKPAVSSKQAAYPITNGLHLKFHAATLVPDAMPAEYSYEPAKGKRGSAKEALTDAAEFGLGSPALEIGRAHV